MPDSILNSGGKETNRLFNENTEPEDGHLNELISAATNKEILCQTALIPIKLIRPFSDYKPKYNEAYERYFQKKLAQREWPFLLVYAKDDSFIMSDDYNAYYQYVKYGATSVFCCVIGMVPLVEGIVPRAEGVVLIGDPFYAENPEVEIID